MGDRQAGLRRPVVSRASGRRGLLRSARQCETRFAPRGRFGDALGFARDRRSVGANAALREAELGERAQAIAAKRKRRPPSSSGTFRTIQCSSRIGCPASKRRSPSPRAIRDERSNTWRAQSPASSGNPLLRDWHRSIRSICAVRPIWPYGMVDQRRPSSENPGSSRRRPALRARTARAARARAGGGDARGHGRGERRVP